MCDGKNGFEKTKHNFPYKWTLKDAIFTKDKGKVFSCFACGGGSTMGYKLDKEYLADKYNVIFSKEEEKPIAKKAVPKKKK